MAGVPVFVPLLEYERNLLVEYKARFESDSRQQEVSTAAIAEAFVKWTWTRRIREAFNTILEDDDWTQYHAGDPTKIWESFNRQAQGYEFEGTYHCRSTAVKDANARTFPQLNGPFSSSTVQMMPPDEDLGHWSLVTSMLETYRSALPAISKVGELDASALQNLRLASDGKDHEAKSPDSSEWTENDRKRENSSTIEIWKLIRQCMLIHRTSIDPSLVAEGIGKTGYYDNIVPVRNGYIKLNSATAFRLQQELYDETTFEHNPVKSIEYIPWSQLSPCLPSGIDTALQDKNFVYWDSPNFMMIEKHYFVEEDVFNFCMQNSFLFPNYLHQNKILFMLSPLQDLKLTGSRDEYWRKFNPDGEWLVLETVPGWRFRRMWVDQSRKVARRYFRNLVDEARFEKSHPSLAAFLDLDYQPKFEGLMTMIPMDQISHVEAKPVGEGDRGVAYRATWDCPQKIHMSSSKRLDVVLKTIKIRGNENLKYFIKELDATYAVVQDATLHCIDLFGVLKTPASNAQSPGTQSGTHAVLPPSTLFLVLELAPYGSLQNWLGHRLSGNESDWRIIIEYAGAIAYGLEEIHRKGVVHRDLHWGNVLVANERNWAAPGPHAPTPELAIADLGEAQLLAGERHGRTYYGNPAFWAPEVRRGARAYSPASDVWALGRLVAEMVLLQWERAGPAAVRSLPEVLRTIVAGCQAFAPADRLTAHEAVVRLEEAEQPWLDEGERSELAFVDFHEGEFEAWLEAETAAPRTDGSDDEEIPR